MEKNIRAAAKFASALAVGMATAVLLSPVSAHANAATIPTDMSVSGMFLQADWIVKLVIIGLLVASIVTWTVFIAKSLELKKRAVAQIRANAAMQGMATLDAARGQAAAATPLLDAAFDELRLSHDVRDDADGIKERIATRFNRIEAETARSLTKGVNILATIGATAPFVGLFGTVWGIMNSFIGIAEKQTTNLAVVAPGIAEALLATAIGLVAAIPAVVIYNHFAKQVAEQRALVADSAAAILNLVSRDLSRGKAG